VSFLDDLLLGIKRVFWNNVEQPPAVNLGFTGSGVASVTYDSVLERIIVDITGGSTAQGGDYNVVPVFGGLTTLTNDSVHDAQNSTGAVLMQIPGGQSTGAWFGVLIDGTPSTGSYYEVIAPGSGGMLQLPLGPDVSTGNTYASTATFEYAEQAGEYFEWVNLGGDRYGLK